MKKTKENWIGEQCSETEEDLKMSNSMICKGIPTRERFDHSKTRESYYCPRSFRRMSHRRTKRYWTDGAVQSQGQWRCIRTELSQDRHRGRPPHPLRRNGGHSTIIKEREVISCSWKIPAELAKQWRACNRPYHDNLQQVLADRRMANPVDQVLSNHTSQERQPVAAPELPNNQPNQSPKQSHAEDHAEQTEATSGEDHCWRTGRLQSMKEYHKVDLQPTNPL